MALEIGEIVAKYIKARDVRDKLNNEHKARVAPLNAAMEKMEGVLLAHFNASGMDSAGCPAGTAYRSTKTSATVEDFDAFLGFVQEHEAWHMLEKRASKTAVEEYVASAKDLPPGIKYSSIASINVRRAS